MHCPDAWRGGGLEAPGAESGAEWAGKSAPWRQFRKLKAKGELAGAMGRPDPDAGDSVNLAAARNGIETGKYFCGKLLVDAAHFLTDVEI